MVQWQMVFELEARAPQVSHVHYDSDIDFFPLTSIMDLFSFLDGAPNEPELDEEMEDPSPPEAPHAPQKRKVTETSDGPSKKAKTDAVESAPNPVVLDDFETEAKREVAASAGLTGGVEAGSRLEIRHQVRVQTNPSRINSNYISSNRLDTRSQSLLLDTTTFPSPNTYLQ